MDDWTSLARDQEGRGGSEEAVPGPSVFPSGEPGVSGQNSIVFCLEQLSLVMRSLHEGELGVALESLQGKGDLI